MAKKKETTKKEPPKKIICTSCGEERVEKEFVNDLASIVGIDYQKYAMEMFKAGTSIKGLTKQEIVNTDLKVFHTEEYSFAVSQLTKK